MVDNKLVNQLFDQIDTLVSHKLEQMTQVKSAEVHSVNQNGTVNIRIPPNNTIYNNIQNQSICRNLHPGDHVKIIIENGNLSNMWIIGGFNSDTFYPVGSVYIAVNNINPSMLFGGVWEQIQDMFLLAAGPTYEAGSMGGESQHILTIDEMPKHRHGIYNTNGSGEDISTLPVDYSATKKGWYGNVYTMNAGGGQAHNNMPPYLTVYMWKRIR